MDDCKIAWDINYDRLITHPDVVNTALRFLDEKKHEVSVGLSIYKQINLGFNGQLGALYPCTPQQAGEVELEGAPLLNNIDDEVLKCET